MVFELVDMGELFYHLRYEGRFSENQSIFFAAQVCKQCNACHCVLSSLYVGVVPQLWGVKKRILEIDAETDIIG